MRIAFALLIALSSVAVADPRPADRAVSIAEDHVVQSGHGPVRFGFDVEAGVLVDAEPAEGGGAPMYTEGAKQVFAVGARDKNVAWAAFDLKRWSACDDAKACKGKPPFATLHVAMLLEKGRHGWSSGVFHYAEPFTSKAYKKALKDGKTLPPLAKKIDAGAEDAVKVFEASIGDPAKLAASVSARKDVVLYGSDLPERYVGGAAVKQQLLKWDLSLKVRDGIQAGVSKGKTVAWVAANVDARPVKVMALPSPYRLLAIYEKVGTSWQLVQASFSFAVNPYADGP